MITLVSTKKELWCDLHDANHLCGYYLPVCSFPDEELRFITDMTVWKTCRNVVSFSDGLPGHGRGIPYFFLTPLDPTARNALEDERSSISISEHPLGTCGKRDPENPTCSKLTLNGKVCIEKLNMFATNL